VRASQGLCANIMLWKTIHGQGKSWLKSYYNLVEQDFISYFWSLIPRKIRHLELFAHFISHFISHIFRLRLVRLNFHTVHTRFDFIRQGVCLHSEFCGYFS
jgi:hypothetical protein